MAPAKKLQRHPRRRTPCSQMPRMYICWVLLTLLALVHGDTSQFRMTYNKGEKKVQFECPTQESLAGNKVVLGAYLSRRMGHNTIEIARYRPSKNESPTVLRNHERVEVALDAKRLVANLTHVTCFDSATYVCRTSVQAGEKQLPNTTEYEHTFTYRGEPTKPVIEKSPLKARYNTGELLTLKCSAITGDSAQDSNNNNDNVIVWEAKRQREDSFQPVSYVTHKAALEELDVKLRDCIPHSSRTLLYRLKSRDDGIVFQCRLNSTNHTSRTTVALLCPQTSTVKEDRASYTSRGVERTVSPSMSDAWQDEEAAHSDTPRIGRLMNEDEEKSNLSDPSLVVILMVMVVCLALGLLSMALFMRQWRKRQMQPLVVMDTPDSSESGYSEQRQLPDLPHFSMLDHHSSNRHHPTFRNTSTPLDVCFRYVPTSFPSSSFSNFRATPTPIANSVTTINTSNHDETDPNVSIYVSMTGLDSLDRQEQKGQQEKKQNLPANNKKNNVVTTTLEEASSAEESTTFRAPGEHDDDDLEPDMREDRSETLYSNQSSVRIHRREDQQLWGGRAREPDQDITLLKTVG